MNCEEASELLPELLAGALGREAELDALTHLARCAGCRGELAFWAQVSMTAKSGADVLPEELFESVREKLFGARTATALESLRIAGRALWMAGSACRLAFSAAGIK